ncbi:Petrobactin biosynthesis protein AsbE [Paenibacillus sp. GSMTC-2017]|nr:DUF6005 family protein [Paenibacillus sp. GSMTC-2017]MBH5319905.1 Petrobactin biosynthesis protein AsbE [Paenibacillus sp. GSMTC-2017]
MKEEVSIKVHCIVSCLCEIVRERSTIDYRPFYFGLWDAPFDVTDRGEVTYYQHDLNHSHYFEWFQMLFGPKVHEWYDQRLSGQDNLDTLLELLKHCPSDRYVIAQIDMSYMPERENKFHQKPFPHFLMLAETDNEDEWNMIDPDFRWRGIVSKSDTINAFLNNTFGGGFYADAQFLEEPTPEMVRNYYKHVFTWKNGLTEKLASLLTEMVHGDNGLDISMIAGSVKQLPVLAIRKYSYEHALMYFIEESGESDETFEAYTDLVEELVKGFHNVQYQGMKMAMTGNKAMLSSILPKLADMGRIETEIKKELHRLYEIWEVQKFGQSALSHELSKEAVR